MTSAINSNIIKTTALNSPTTALALVSSNTTTTINLGLNGTVQAINVVTPTVKQKVYYFSTQTFSPTVANFLNNGTIVISLFSSQSPISTANDIITINLPPPTLALDGCYFIFKKLRGIFSNGTTNFTFNTTPASFLPAGSSLTSGTTPITSSQSFNSGIVRMYVVSYLGTAYWTFA